MGQQCFQLGACPLIAPDNSILPQLKGVPAESVKKGAPLRPEKGSFLVLKIEVKH